MSRTPVTRRLLSRRSSIVLAILAAAGMGAWFTLPGGFLHRWFQPDPQVDSTTPRTQNGFRLAEAHAEGDANSSAALYILVQPPSFPECQRQNEQDGHTLYSLPGSGFGPYNSFNIPRTAPILQATGQTSEGDVLPLQWSIVGDALRPKYLRIDIPGGYSNACHFVDVTLVTHTGAFPKWRVTRLPPMHQVISDTPQVQTAHTVEGIPVSARAWRTRHEIDLQVLPLLPPGSHQWEIGPRQSYSEWENFDQPHPATDPLNYKPIEGRNGHFTRNDTVWYGSLTTTFPGDYRSSSRFVRFDCNLIQYETLDERITFPNVSIQDNNPTLSKTSEYDEAQTYYASVSTPVTAMTPSGIAVTLPAQGTSTSAATLLSGNINVRLSVKPMYSPDELPQSPLVRQFGKPIAVSIKFAPPDIGSGLTMEPGETQDYALQRPTNPKWSFRLPREQMQKIPLHLAPPSHRDLTVIVHQRVELQTIPLSFTVPVADMPPTDIHW